MLWANYSINTLDNKENTLGYDEKGKIIKNFIFSREATFNGGERVWIRYLQKSIPLKYVSAK